MYVISCQMYYNINQYYSKKFFLYLDMIQSCFKWTDLSNGSVFLFKTLEEVERFWDNYGDALISNYPLIVQKSVKVEKVTLEDNRVLA